MSWADDRFEIQDCLLRYARAVDRLDYEGIAECYFPDALDSHGIYVGNVVGLIDHIRERHRTIESCQHYITNILVEFDSSSSDVAFAESYCLLYFRHAPSPVSAMQEQGVTRCRYVDRFERRASRWAIADRAVVFDEAVSREITNVCDPTWFASVRDRSDPVYTWGRSADTVDPD